MARGGDVIAEFYRLQDACLGRLLARLDAGDLVVLVSDHGGGAKGTRIFNPNAWLTEQGLFSAAGAGQGRGGLAPALLRGARRAAQQAGVAPLVKRALGRRAARARALADSVDWARTRAYYTPLFYPSAGLHLNVRGRQPNGTIEPGAEYEALRDRLLDGLRALRDPRSGARVIREVYRREELYRGEHLEDAPDVVFLTDPVYLTWSRVDRAFVDAPPPGEHDWNGDHRIDGILCLTGDGVFRSATTVSGATAVDVAPTLLHAAGLPIPSDLDGRVLEEVFQPTFLRQRSVQVGTPLNGVGGAAQEYSEEEEEGIRAALRGLGYIE